MDNVIWLLLVFPPCPQVVRFARKNVLFWFISENLLIVFETKKRKLYE